MVTEKILCGHVLILHIEESLLQMMQIMACKLLRESLQV
jgi:hypothetical protein